MLKNERLNLMLNPGQSSQSFSKAKQAEISSALFVKTYKEPPKNRPEQEYKKILVNGHLIAQF